MHSEIQVYVFINLSCLVLYCSVNNLHIQQGKLGAAILGSHAARDVSHISQMYIQKLYFIKSLSIFSCVNFALCFNSIRFCFMHQNNNKLQWQEFTATFPSQWVHFSLQWVHSPVLYHVCLLSCFGWISSMKASKRIHTITTGPGE